MNKEIDLVKDINDLVVVRLSELEKITIVGGDVDMEAIKLADILQAITKHLPELLEKHEPE